MSCEEENKCCKCLDIKQGVQIMGVFSVLGCLGVFGSLGALFGGYIVGACLGFVFLVPQFIAAYWFFEWHKNDNKESRDNLPKAQIMIAITQIGYGVVQALAGLGMPGFGAGGLTAITTVFSIVISTVISLVLTFYFWVVCKKFAA